MISDKNREKVQNFFAALSKVQPNSGKDIGMIVIKNETTADLIGLTENSNNTAIFELDKNTYPPDFFNNLSLVLQGGKVVFIRLHDYLDPKIYNQLYLIANNGRMEFFEGKKDKVTNIPKKATLILVTGFEELEKLNYKDIFNIIGPVLRLE